MKANKFLLLLVLCFVVGVSSKADEFWASSHSNAFERIPCEEIGIDSHIGNIYYKTVTIWFSKDILPMTGSVVNCDARGTDTLIKYLDTSTAVIPKEKYKGHPIPKVTPYTYGFLTSEDVTVQIMDMCTGETVFKDFFRSNSDSFLKNADNIVNNLITVSDLHHKIDISKIPHNTAYFVFWFNSDNELFFVDRIRFGYWTYDKIIQE